MPSTVSRIPFVFLAVLTVLTLIPLDRANAATRVTTYDTFDTDEPVVALTFDVTLDRGDGPEILDILAENNVRATFAITGVWALTNPDLIYRIVNEGHQLINHTWDHPSFTGEYTGSLNFRPVPPIDREEIISQLERTNGLILEQVGVDMRPYVRPPYGDYSDESLAAMADAGYTKNIMWTVDTFGWHGDPAEEVTERALEAAQPGANILLHVGHGSTDGEALPAIIEGFRARGYDFAAVEDFVEGHLARQRPTVEFSEDILFSWWRFDGFIRYRGLLHS